MTNQKRSHFLAQVNECSHLTASPHPTIYTKSHLKTRFMSMFSNLRLDSVSDIDRKGKPSTSEICSISINPTGTRVVNTRLDRTIRVWKCLSSSLSDAVVIESTHKNEVTSVAWVPNTDSDFATVGGDSSVKIWKSSGVLEREVDLGQGALRHVSFSADGSLLAAASTDCIQICDGNYTPLHRVAVEGVTDVAWLNQGHSMLVATAAGPVLVYRIGPTPDLVHTFSGPRSVTCLLVDPRGRYLAAGSREGVVYVWRTTDLMSSGVIADVDSQISALCCSGDGSYIYVGYGSDHNSRVYDSTTLSLVHEVKGTPRSHVAWVPNRQIIIFSEAKNKVMGFGFRDDARERDDREKREREKRADDKEKRESERRPRDARENEARGKRSRETDTRGDRTWRRR